MAKVLYLIGAGASATVLPIIDALKDETNTIIRWGLNDELRAFAKKVEIYDGFEIYSSLCTESASFTTPDTFAKFLYCNNRDSDYIKFKTLISVYFFWKERIEKKNEECLDKRVISFLTTLSETNGVFPKQVKLISWNYDSQIIRAIEKARSSSINNSFLRNFKNFPFSMDSTIDKIDLSCIHLNGIAGYSYNQKTNKNENKLNDIPSPFVFDSIANETVEEQLKIKRIFEIFSSPNENLLISYAWEKQVSSNRDYEYSEQRIEYAKALARGADILVVIGYSFPFFNREIDSEIFKEMPTLKKIYFQDPKLNGQFLYSQFNLSKDRIDIEHIKDVKNYYVPHEL